MFKNVTGQKWSVMAWNASTGLRKTGDAGQITAKISIDDASAATTNDANPTEVEDGRYAFTMPQAETNGDKLELYPQSSTSNIEVIGLPAVIYTVEREVGPGASSVTMTITESGNAVADADVWITSDSAGNTVIGGTLQTDSDGKAVFLLDAGTTYYLWMQKDGTNSILGESFTAVAD